MGRRRRVRVWAAAGHDRERVDRYRRNRYGPWALAWRWLRRRWRGWLRRWRLLWSLRASRLLWLLLWLWCWFWRWRVWDDFCVMVDTEATTVQMQLWVRSFALAKEFTVERLALVACGWLCDPDIPDDFLWHYGQLPAS